MTDVFSDEYWQNEFDVTKDDLDRIVERIRKNTVAFSLEQIVKRVVRGRLEHGADYSDAALPDWVTESKVLSWDSEDQWAVGSKVLVARNIDGTIRPFFGQIVSATGDRLLIHIEEFEEPVKYKRAKPGTDQIQKRVNAIRKAILERKQTVRRKDLDAEIGEKLEIVLLQYGPYIATRLLTALNHDKRFVIVQERWLVKDLLVDVPSYQIDKLYNRMFTSQTEYSMKQIISFIRPALSEGDIRDFSIHFALQQNPKRFQHGKKGWVVIKPPPPPWNQAVGAYYFYDPETYQIILQPGEKLKKKAAERLEELGYYAEVVTADAA